MLPLLPALILLILQGPTNVERMALDGRLPAALDAIHRQMESTGSEHASLKAANGMALVSLLAMSGDPQFSQALVKLLAMSSGDAVEAKPSGKQYRDQFADDLANPPPCPRRLGSLTDGFFGSQRSRDGPAVLA
jgi:hypothetical protein